MSFPGAPRNIPSDFQRSFLGTPFQNEPNDLRQRDALREAREDALLLASIAGEPFPSIETLEKYSLEPMTAGQIERFLERRKNSHYQQLNALYEAEAKALRELDKELWMTTCETDRPKDREYYKKTNIAAMENRYASLAQTLWKSYTDDIKPKQERLHQLRHPRPPPMPARPIPIVSSVPTSFLEFKRLPEEYKSELVELLFNAVASRITQREIDATRFFKGHTPAAFNSLRNEYKRDEEFRASLLKQWNSR